MGVQNVQCAERQMPVAQTHPRTQADRSGIDWEEDMTHKSVESMIVTHPSRKGNPGKVSSSEF
jgi:hypothetical protein